MINYKQKYMKYKYKYLNAKKIMKSKYNIYGGSSKNTLIQDITDIVKNKQGYVDIFRYTFHAPIFVECHTRWKELLKNIINKQLNIINDHDNDIIYLTQLKNKLIQ